WVFHSSILTRSRNRGISRSCWQVVKQTFWKLAADGARTYVQGVHVTCRPARDHLLIVLRGKAWTKELFGDRPTTVQFETDGTQLTRTKTMVRVDYELDQKDSDG